QLSATSQSSAAGRHSSVLLASAGQVPLSPGHVSGRSQGPAASRQTTLASSNWQAGSQQSPLCRLPSSHCSPGSTTPFPHATAWNGSSALWLVGAVGPADGLVPLPVPVALRSATLMPANS